MYLHAYIWIHTSPPRPVSLSPRPKQTAHQQGIGNPRRPMTKVCTRPYTRSSHTTLEQSRGREGEYRRRRKKEKNEKEETLGVEPKKTKKVEKERELSLSFAPTGNRTPVSTMARLNDTTTLLVRRFSRVPDCSGVLPWGIEPVVVVHCCTGLVDEACRSLLLLVVVVVSVEWV